MRTLLHYGMLTAVVAAVGGCAASPKSRGTSEDTSADQTGRTIVSVELHSFPSGEGSAYHALRKVSAEGRVEGGHISGSPEAPRVYHETKQISQDQVDRVWRQAEALASVWRKEWSVDRKAKHMAIVIVRSDGSQLRVAWPFDSKPRTGEAQALYETLTALQAGGW